MKSIFLLLVCMTFTLVGATQTSFSIEYELTIEASGEEADATAMFFEGSSMVVAGDGVQSYVKTVMGIIGTMEIEVNQKTKDATVFMITMYDSLAYQGIWDEPEQDVMGENPKFEFLRGRSNKKRILGYKCKKAISKEEDGSVSVYWYTKKIKRPNVDIMPSSIPGACLEIETTTDEAVLTYTAVKLREKVDMNDFRINIPDGIKVRPLSEMGE